MKTFTKKTKGAYLPVVMLVSVLLAAFIVAVISMSLWNLKIAKKHEFTVSELEIAEAGVNYYMWHLAHDNQDYCDGHTCVGDPPYGPFTHQYKDQDGVIVGNYDLYITPPELGDSTTTVRSIGRKTNSVSDRAVIAELGMPSFARYAFVINTECWFGENETTVGPVHSNIGVHFDGTAQGIVSSAQTTYTPSWQFGGDGQIHDGVWGDGGPNSYWVFPVPPVDFNKISVDFVNLRESADDNGIHLTDSRSRGYYLYLRPDGRIDIYRVSQERNWGITANFIETRDAPKNGIVYVEDNVWIDGTYDNRITIATHTEGSGSPVIKIKDNLLYQNKDGSASIGLVAEGNIEVPRYAVNNLEIDAALLSQTGHVWFPYVSGAVKNSIIVYGSIGTDEAWTWTWVTSGGTVVSGYRYTTQEYDPYLTLQPPPEFPSTGTFAILNWREE